MVINYVVIPGYAVTLFRDEAYAAYTYVGPSYIEHEFNNDFEVAEGLLPQSGQLVSDLILFKNWMSV